MTHPANAQIAPMLVQCLEDIRMLAIRLFIENLLERKTYGDGIERYRVKDARTNTPITSMAQLLSHITADTIEVGYPYQNAEGMLGDRITGVEVTLKHLQVRFHELARSDEFFSAMYDTQRSNTFRFVLHMAYMNDAVDDAPVMKTYHVRLVRNT